MAQTRPMLLPKPTPAFLQEAGFRGLGLWLGLVLGLGLVLVLQSHLQEVGNCSAETI